MYHKQIVVPFYKYILRFSKRKGEHTIARIDAFMFKSKREITINHTDNISIVLPADSHFFRYLLNSHEPHISNTISKLVKKNDVVVDVGANVGYFSAYAAAAVGKYGRVFCFEPESKNFEILKENCDLIQRNELNCIPYKLAVSSVAGRATLNIHQYSTHHAVENENYWIDKIENTQEINTVTLDEWAKSEGIREISLLKVDTEGHEHKVLEGAKKLFEAQAIAFTILECRSDYLAIFIDEFCQKYNMHQLVWDGLGWHKASLQSLKYKTECLLSTQSISPTLLC